LRAHRDFFPIHGWSELNASGLRTPSPPVLLPKFMSAIARLPVLLPYP
jgi:hypothetical protein